MCAVWWCVLVQGVLAVRAVSHVFRVVLHLDRGVGEAKLGLQDLRGLLQNVLPVSILL